MANTSPLVTSIATIAPDFALGALSFIFISPNWLLKVPPDLADSMAFFKDSSAVFWTLLSIVK